MKMHRLYAKIDRQLRDNLPVGPVTRNLVFNLLLDLPLTPAQCSDFGVDSNHHARALKALLGGAVEEGMSLATIVLKLDRVLADGDRLNKLVKRYAPEYRDVRFVTHGVRLSASHHETTG